MSFRVELPPTFAQRLDRKLIGFWSSAGSATNTEILAASGADWLLIDGEHSPYGLETITELLRATAPYPATAVVRVPVCDTVLIKQYLDLGAQNLMVPMVHTIQEAEKAVAAMHYPPRGERGVGSALARSSRWNTVSDYLARASDTVSLIVQIESAQAVDNVEEIAALDGVDALFVGPSDLAASMGLLGQQTHPEVVAAVEHIISVVNKPVGVNAFDTKQAATYLERGAAFALVGADVQLLSAAVRSTYGLFTHDE